MIRDDMHIFGNYVDSHARLIVIDNQSQFFSSTKFMLRFLELRGRKTTMERIRNEPITTIMIKTKPIITKILKLLLKF